MKHALIYLRVSTTEQARRGAEPDGFSIPAQRRACRQIADRLGVTSSTEFVDRGESGRSTRRPGLQALLRALVTEHPSVVVVHKIDRLARNLHDDVVLRLAIRGAGAELVSTTEQIDQSPSGQLFHNLLAGMNEFYSANLAAEALKGATEKARQGGTPYRAPLGYCNVSRRFEDREIRTVELDPERATHIRWAFEAYASGAYTLSTLRHALMARGLRPRRRGLVLRPISTSLLAHLLANRYYLGFVPYNGEEHPGHHPPLVTPHTFAAVQLVLASHRHGERRQAHQHPLKGSLFCGRCRGPLTFSRAKGRYGYFFCLARHRSHSCDLPYLPTGLVEAAVVEQFRHLPLAPGQRRHVCSVLQRELDSTSHHLDEQIKALEAQGGRLDRQQARLLQAHYDEIIAPDLFRTEQGRIDRERADAQELTEQLTRQRTDQVAGNVQALEAARNLDLAEAYAESSGQVQRFLTRACFRRLELDDLGTGEPDGHGLQHAITVTRAATPRTPDYQQLVYALLTLISQ